MNVCILLTTTVYTHNINFNNQSNPEIRLNQYISKITKWLNDTSFNIVVIENSGYKFSELPDNNDRFEKITFDYSEIPFEDKLYLNNTKAKGQHEAYAIKYAYENSRLLKSADYIIKITGRFYIPDFEKILLEKLTEEVIFIRQIKTHKCEITGCRKDLFNILFNFPKKHDHVEIAYRDAINHYRKPLVHWATNSKNVLTLPVLKLDEKTTRGIGTYYTEL